MSVGLLEGPESLIEGITVGIEEENILLEAVVGKEVGFAEEGFNDGINDVEPFTGAIEGAVIDGEAVGIMDMETGATDGIVDGNIEGALIEPAVGMNDGEVVGAKVITITVVEFAVFKATLAPGVVAAVACRVLVKLPDATLFSKEVV